MRMDQASLQARAFGNASASGVGSPASAEFQVAWEQAVAAKWLALEVRPQRATTAGGVGTGGSFGVLAVIGGLGRCLGHCMTQGGGQLGCLGLAGFGRRQWHGRSRARLAQAWCTGAIPHKCEVYTSKYKHTDQSI